MIEDESNKDLIRWAPKGETFIVTDSDRLAAQELPKYFKHSNFTSLVRQLNMYGFHKVTNAGGVKTATKDEPQIWEFVHPCVHRGRPELLVHVKRKVPENTSSKKKMAKGDASTLVAEMMSLRDHHAMLKHKFEAVQRQNEALWKEIAEHRHRHAQQQWKIERIMKYINALYVHGEAGAAFKHQPKKGRTMSAPPAGLGDSFDGRPAAAAAAAAPTFDLIDGAAGAAAPALDTREDTSTPFHHSHDTMEAGAHVAKQLMIPDLHHETGHPKEAHEVHHALETHLGEYDVHLGRHAANLEKHLDDHFMASIFNPPNGADILGPEAAEEPLMKSADFDAFSKAMGGEDRRGIKRNAAAISTDDELLNRLEIFTPLHEFISDAVVPE